MEQHLTKEQIMVIVTDAQFIKKVKALQFDLKMSRKEAFNELISQIAYTSRSKIFVSVVDSLNSRQHAHLEYAKKDVMRHSLSELNSRKENEVSIEKLKADSMKDWQDGEFDVTYEMSDIQFEDVGTRFTHRERKAVLDNLDSILTKPSAKFVRYLMTYGQEATMAEFGLSLKYFNNKITSLIQTIKGDKTQKKIEDLGLHSDTYYQWQDDIEELNWLSESGDGQDIMEYVLSHEGNEAYWSLYEGLNYQQLIYLRDNWDETIYARQLGYKLMDNINEQLNYMESYIYY